MKLPAIFLLFSVCTAAPLAVGETRTMTLRQALDQALAQNPDLLLARLDQQKARSQVTVTRDPFIPKVLQAAARRVHWISQQYRRQRPLHRPGAGADGAVQPAPELSVAQGRRKRPAVVGIDVSRRQEEVIYAWPLSNLDAGRPRAASKPAANRRQTWRCSRIDGTSVWRRRELPLESKKANDLSVSMMIAARATGAA